MYVAFPTLKYRNTHERVVLMSGTKWNSLKQSPISLICVTSMTNVSCCPPYEYRIQLTLDANADIDDEYIDEQGEYAEEGEEVAE
jgi:hypothetical protein